MYKWLLFTISMALTVYVEAKTLIKSSEKILLLSRSPLFWSTLEPSVTEEVINPEPLVFTSSVVGFFTILDRIVYAWVNSKRFESSIGRTELDCVFADGQSICNSCKALESTKSWSNAEFRLGPKLVMKKVNKRKNDSLYHLWELIHRKCFFARFFFLHLDCRRLIIGRFLLTPV